MAFSIPIAKFSDKHGFASGILLGTILSASARLVLAFVFPATRWLFIVYICLFTISQAATYQNSFNIGYTILPQKYMVQAMAIKQTAQGLVAFVAAMGAGALVSLVQANSNRVFDIPMYGQQLLALIALLMQIPGIILIYKFVIKPIKKLKENT